MRKFLIFILFTLLFIFFMFYVVAMDNYFTGHNNYEKNLSDKIRL